MWTSGPCAQKFVAVKSAITLACEKVVSADVRENLGLPSTATAGQKSDDGPETALGIAVGLPGQIFVLGLPTTTLMIRAA